MSVPNVTFKIVIGQCSFTILVEPPQPAAGLLGYGVEVRAGGVQPTIDRVLASMVLWDVLAEVMLEPRDGKHPRFAMTSCSWYSFVSGNPAPAIWRALQALNRADYHVTVSGELGAGDGFVRFPCTEVAVVNLRPVRRGIGRLDLEVWDEEPRDGLVVREVVYGNNDLYATSIKGFGARGAAIRYRIMEAIKMPSDSYIIGIDRDLVVKLASVCASLRLPPC